MLIIIFLWGIRFRFSRVKTYIMLIESHQLVLSSDINQQFWINVYSQEKLSVHPEQNTFTGICLSFPADPLLFSCSHKEKSLPVRPVLFFILSLHQIMRYRSHILLCCLNLLSYSRRHHTGALWYPRGTDIDSRLKLAREDSSHPCQGVHQAFKSGKWSTEKEEEEMMLSDTGGHSNRRNINITLFRFPPVSLKYYIGFYVLLLNLCWQQEITIKCNRRLRASWGWWDIKPQKCFRNFKILVLRRESLNGHLTRWR